MLLAKITILIKFHLSELHSFFFEIWYKIFVNTQSSRLCKLINLKDYHSNYTNIFDKQNRKRIKESIIIRNMS